MERLYELINYTISITNILNIFLPVRLIRYMDELVQRPDLGLN